MSVESHTADSRSTEAWWILPKELREEIGTCELGFEGCVEVRQVEKYNPDKEDGIGEGDENARI